jgi:PadR family transcriptional regulator, regulatory protein AphA
LTSTEAALLGLLTRGERSGYDLQKLIDHSVGYFWASAKTQIYTTLPRLTEARLVTRRDVAQEQRPDKQVYRITRRGERALQDWLAVPPEPQRPRNELLLKLFFGELTSPDIVLGHVRARREEAERLRDNLVRLNQGSSGGPGDHYPALTRRAGLEYAQATIRWARTIERELGS